MEEEVLREMLQGYSENSYSLAISEPLKAYSAIDVTSLLSRDLEVYK